MKRELKEEYDLLLYIPEQKKGNVILHLDINVIKITD